MCDTMTFGWNANGKLCVCLAPRIQMLFNLGMVRVDSNVEEPKEVWENAQPSGTCYEMSHIELH